MTGSMLLCRGYALPCNLGVAGGSLRDCTTVPWGLRSDEDMPQWPCSVTMTGTSGTMLQ